MANIFQMILDKHPTSLDYLKVYVVFVIHDSTVFSVGVRVLQTHILHLED